MSEIRSPERPIELRSVKSRSSTIPVDAAELARPESWPASLQTWGTAVAVLVALAVLLAGITGVTYALVARDQARAVATAFGRTRDYARLAQAGWTDTLARIQALHRLARLVSLARMKGDSTNEAIALDALRSEVAATMPAVTEVRGVDLRGEVTWSTLERQASALNISGEEPVRAILEHGFDTFVGRPMTGILSKRQSIHFACALRRPDGTLDGLTLVSLDTSQINAMARRLGLGDTSFVAVVRADGMLLARSDGRDVGENLTAKDPSLPGLLIQEDTQKRGPSLADGVPRLVVRRSVPGSGTAVAAGLDEAEALAPARAAAAQMWRWSLLLEICLVALAGLLLLLLRQGRLTREERLRHAGHRAQETFLRQIADEAIDMIALLDHQHRFRYVNPACGRLLDVAPSSLLGESAVACVMPGHRGQVQAALDTLMLGGRPRRMLVPLMPRGNADARWVEIEASHILWPGQDSSLQTGCFFIARDVTERKQADDALQRAREDLETVARAGPGALYRLSLAADGARLLLFLADTGRSDVGFSEEDARAPGFLQARLHPDDASTYEAGIATLRQHGETTMEYRLRGRDGQYRWMRDSCVVTEAQGGTLLVSGYWCEITREKEQATQLESARRLLNLGEMASGLAHELNQPLAAVSMAAENGRTLLARSPPAVGAAREKFAVIGGLAERAMATIESMLVFGRADAPSPVPVDLEDVVCDAMAVVHARLERERIAMRLTLPAALPRVMAVPVLLQQVFVNLVANACDAYETIDADEADREIAIRAASDSGRVIVHVTDHAGGIPPDVLPRIFEPFFTTKQRRGTGMGLAVTDGIIRQIGGTIAACNQDGGATFEIGLPTEGGENPAATDVLAIARMAGR